MARSESRGVGNTAADRNYIEWMRLHENGGLKVIEPDVDEVPFPAKMIWDGDDDDDDSPWKVPPPTQRCSGKAYVRDEDGDYILDKKRVRIMRPCWRWPMKGAAVCLMHGGGIGRVKKSAIERLASSLDAASGALVKIALNENESAKDRIKAIENIMDRVGVRGGVEVDIKDPGYLDVLKKVFDKAKIAADSDEEDEDDE